MNDTAMVNDHYEDGVCPDCGAIIPENTESGEACKNCGHVFWVADNKNPAL